MLRYLAERAVGLGDTVEMVERRPFDGPFLVRCGGDARATDHELGPALAAAIWVDVGG